MKAYFAALCLAVMPTIALADEVWNSSLGQITYLTDVGSTAVFSVGVDFQIYIDGLGGQYSQNSGTYSGYWIDSTNGGAGDCPQTVTAPDGWSSRNWGNVQLTFDPDGFHRSYTMLLNYCRETTWTSQTYAQPRY
ncbi:hypothetical protein [Nioella nitratireducens]|uniref:hypothetical protein n=1 Tax=Nioella nitratireducens TaxID=1287720 RepID=UPI0008FD3BD0|nr:hypothetical protein [Nioella nitratireducens]